MSPEPEQRRHLTLGPVVTPKRAAWHHEQFLHPKRSTVHLREFAARIVGRGDAPSEVLDAACGAGANMFHLSELWPTAHWTGVDLDAGLVEAGRERLDPERFSIVTGDLLSLEEAFGAKRFDVCFSIMALSWLDDYERAVGQMLMVTKSWLFILNLFSETDLDAFIHVVGRSPGHLEGHDEYYNVYSLPRFDEFCRGLGARETVAEQFEIDIDLPRPDHRGMGSFTERTFDGRRLQFSGPLLMPWWFVAVGIGNSDPRQPVGSSVGRPG
jgi:ubiquinone/menaquinone biosynthesis C-methylase UbiE